MTIFELYSANVPLLVPDASLLRKLGCVASLAHYGGGASYDRPCRGGARPWSQLGSAASVDFFIKRADFYDAHPVGMPHVHTFRSMEDLGKQLAAIDTRKTSAAMKETNCLRACRVRSAWRCLMQTAFPALQGTAAAARPATGEVTTSAGAQEPSAGPQPEPLALS